jgi:signal transduction histidine kinase
MEHKQIPGNGFGFSIVKKFADAIGAEIKVTSILGQGITGLILF